MSVRTVLGAVGAIVGAIYGGPAGARWGFTLGSLVGGIVDPGTVKGPSLGDIATQTAQEGGPIPIVFGMSQPITGNVIGTSSPRIDKTKSSGKGGPKVVTETVYLTYAIGVCEGPITAFRRVWRNNIMVYDATPDPLVTPEDNAKFLETARFFLGTYDQLPSPDLEAIYGVGTTAAHRGTVYMVMANEDVTDMAGAIPQWQFQVSTGVAVETLSNDVLFPWGAGGSLDPRNVDNWHRYSYYLQSIASSGPDSGAHVGTWFGGTDYGAGLSSAVAEGNVNGWSADPIGGYAAGPYGWSVNLRTMSPVHSPVANEAVTLYLHYNYQAPTYFQGAVPSAGGSSVFCRYAGSFTPPLLISSPGRLDWWSPVDSGETGGTFWAGVWGRITELTHPTGGNNCTFGSWQRSADTNIRLQRRPRSPLGEQTQVFGSFKVLADYADNGTNVTQYPLNPCLEVGDPLDVPAFWTAAYNAAVLAGDMPAGKTYGVHYPVAKAYAWAGSAILTDLPIAVDDVVTAICARASTPASLIDVTQLDGMLTSGIVITNQYAAAQGLQALGEIYRFDMTSADAQIRFIARGADAVAIITEQDMVLDDADIEQYKRADAISVPRVLNLNYYDITGALSTAKQTSERGGDRRAVGDSSIESPVLMDTATAAQAVDIAHKVAIEEAKGELKFMLPDSFIGLIPSDPIIVQWQSRSERVRIIQLTIMDGYQEYVCVRDRQSAYTSMVEGIPPPAPTPVPTRIPGPTLLQVLDIPLLADADDNIGLMYYVAANGTRESWGGALIEISYDSGATYVDSRTVSQGPVMGVLTSELADHPQDFPDAVHSFTVQLQSVGAELIDTDLEGMLNRTNLAAIGSSFTGWELINFANVDQLDSDGDEWEIDYLLRGRKDTDTLEHAAGAAFVLLDRALLATAPANMTDLNHVLTFRATSLGESTDTGTVVSMNFRGRSQIERHVGYLMARRDGSNLIVDWQNVCRLGGGALVANGIRFDGYSLTFDDGVNQITVATDAQTYTQDVSALSYPITVSVLQRNELTGDGESLEVIVT